MNQIQMAPRPVPAHLEAHYETMRQRTLDECQRLGVKVYRHGGLYVLRGRHVDLRVADLRHVTTGDLTTSIHPLKA